MGHMDSLTHVNSEAMHRPGRGPKSQFYVENDFSQHDSVCRNTRSHWHLHWYILTRGRPLLKFTELVHGVSHVKIRQAASRVKMVSLPQHRGAKDAWGEASNDAISSQAADAVDTSRGQASKADDTSLEKQISMLRAKVWTLCEENPVINSVVFFAIVVGTVNDIIETETRVAGPKDSMANVIVAGIDTTCIIIFTIEFVVRLASTPSVAKFSRNPMNWIDFLAILPSYISYIFLAAAASDDTGNSAGESEILQLSTLLRLLRLTRMARVFKVARYSFSVRTFILAIYQSIYALIVLFMIIFMVVLLFGASIYYVELGVAPEDRDDPCGDPCFSSIIATSWTVVNTVTTAGYGDAYPTTALGKVVCAAASVTGIVVLALPIAVFESNFNRIYRARDVCHRRIKDLTRHEHVLINEDVIGQWLAIQARCNRLGSTSPEKAGSQKDVVADETLRALSVANHIDPGAKRSMALKTQAVEALDPRALLVLYDRDGRGYLQEGEALLMMADLEEYFAPDDTIQLNALLSKLSNVAHSSISKSLSRIEERQLGAEHAHEQTERQNSLAQPGPLKEEMFTVNVVRDVKKVVQRNHWTAPEAARLTEGESQLAKLTPDEEHEQKLVDMTEKLLYNDSDDRYEDLI